MTLVEYGDFQCPYCGDAYPVVRELLESFELAALRLPPHAAARPAPARAGRRRGRRGGQRPRAASGTCTTGCSSISTRSPTPTCATTPAALGLDVERFERELREGVHKARIDEDYASGAASGIPSTPRFFVNGSDAPRVGQRARAAEGDRGGVRLMPPWTVEDQDACALYGGIAKDGRPAHDPVERLRRAAEDASPRRQRRRRGRRLRSADRHPARRSGRRRSATAATRPSWRSTRRSPSPTSSSRARPTSPGSSATPARS